MSLIIPIQVKKECCRMKQEGYGLRQIYNDYYIENVEDPCSYEGFRRMLLRWENKTFPDDTTLERGTYDGFIAHNATVQVSSTGQIVQAWIKQKASDFNIEDLVETLRENVEHYEYVSQNEKSADRMLEIPLFDMHWGISFLDDYKQVLDDILDRIYSRHWDKIVIPFGQDFFHNDSIVNATTTGGTTIDKVDMVRAVKEGRQFITAIVDAALENSNSVKVLYTPGNPDRSVT